MSRLQFNLTTRARRFRKLEDARGGGKYREALKLDPKHTGIRLNYAAALLHLGRWGEGVAELREILREDPNNLAARRTLNYVLAHPLPGREREQSFPATGGGIRHQDHPQALADGGLN